MGQREAILGLLQAADTGIIDMRSREKAEEGAEIEFRHRTTQRKAAWLPLRLQSMGTRALIELAPRVTRALRNGTLLCVDELEGSLHPTAASAVLNLFQNRAQNPKGAQLLFTTHDTNLLGNMLGEPALRRDQIWFTEKDADGATHLYPMTDFEPRPPENLERGYLQGRYGAIPFIGELQQRSAAKVT